MKSIIENLIQKVGSTSPEKFCKYLGIKIWYTEINFLGFIININNEANIFINSELSRLSRDFVILHELAHYLFHPLDRFIPMRDYIMKQNDKMENEANKFAVTALHTIYEYNYYEEENDLDIKILKVINRLN